MTKILLIMSIFLSSSIIGFCQSSVPNKDEYIEVDEEPVSLNNIHDLIIYPEKARQESIEGKVIASILINESGDVLLVEIDSSTNTLFNQSTKDALIKAKFTPAKQKGKPVKVWWTVPVSYKLSPENKYEDTLESEPIILDDVYSHLIYPTDSAEGIIFITLFINSNGIVEKAKVNLNPYGVFADPILKATRSLRFLPARKNGKAIPTWWLHPVIINRQSKKNSK